MTIMDLALEMLALHYPKLNKHDLTYNDILHNNRLFGILADILITDKHDDCYKVTIDKVPTQEIKEWLNSTVGCNHWLYCRNDLYFDNKNNAVLFKTRWL